MQLLLRGRNAISVLGKDILGNLDECVRIVEGAIFDTIVEEK